MLVFLYPRVLSRGACFSVASPCLWGKLENLSFSNVSKQVVMLFCVADVALFDIPTCLMMFTKLQNWRKSRTKCCFSRMRSKGSRFTLGVWGLRVCSLDVAFASATVRNRPQPSARGPYGRAYGKFCRGGNFWRFQTCRCFVSRGRRGTS